MQQVTVEEHGQAVGKTDRRHTTDGEPGDLPDAVRVGAFDAFAQARRQRLRVDAVRAGDEHKDQVGIARREDERFHDSVDRGADGRRGRDGRRGAGVELDDLRLEPGGLERIADAVNRHVELYAWTRATLLSWPRSRWKSSSGWGKRSRVRGR